MSGLSDSCTSRSAHKVYLSRTSWDVPTHTYLLDIRPGFRKPLRIDILESTGQSLTAQDASLLDCHADVATSWYSYVLLLSWWQFKRYFYRRGNSVKCKYRPAVVVVHPIGHFSTATTPTQWRDASFWTLFAHCNHLSVGEHGIQFRDDIFPSLDALQDPSAVSDEQLHQLTYFCDDNTAAARRNASESLFMSATCSQ